MTLECIDEMYDDECRGMVELRIPMSPSGISYPRCHKHYMARVAVQEQIVGRYGGKMYYDGPEPEDDPYAY